MARERNLVRRIEIGPVTPYSPIPRSGLFFVSCGRASSMTTSRSQELSEKCRSSTQSKSS